MPIPVDVVVMLHSHLPYVLNHGRWPHGSDWICEAAIDTYLPLVERLRALDAAKIAAPVTIGFTPILANQLEHPTFHAELDAYFEQRLGFCDEAPASLTSTGDAHLIPLVGYWRERLVRLQRVFHEINRDIAGEFRRLQDAGRLEITSSAATHGFLPLLGRDESIRLQLHLGRREHRRIFGRDPQGCWVPECAYRPAGWWQPLPEAPDPREREGTETHLSRAGYRYFFVDSHMARAGSPLGIYGELFGGEAERVAGLQPGRDASTRASRTPYRAYRVTTAHDPRPVAAFVRDPKSSMQVWSRDGGYPGAWPYLEFHKIRWPGGLKLWRVSAPGTDLGAKEPYDPEGARYQARAHALHFAALLEALAADTKGTPKEVIVAPFDTELFGHWWFEGPDFLGDFYEQLPGTAHLRAATVSQHLEAHDVRTGLRLAEGSWGANGDYSMWMNDQVAWTWPVVWELEERFWGLAPQALAHEALREILAQAARSLLLLQSSDWQFIISTGEVEDYAIRRFNGHAEDTRLLLDALRDGLAGRDVSRMRDVAAALQQRDDVFRDILPSVAAALEPAETARVPRGRPKRGARAPVPPVAATPVPDKAAGNKAATAEDADDAVVNDTVPRTPRPPSP